MTERYARHSIIDWFSQDKVHNSKVAVIGAGAVGNEVVKNLALLGVGEIHIYDYDKIEIHNLTRSIFFRETDVGAEKSKSSLSVRRKSTLTYGAWPTLVTSGTL